MNQIRPTMATTPASPRLRQTIERLVQVRFMSFNHPQTTFLSKNQGFGENFKCGKQQKTVQKSTFHQKKSRIQTQHTSFPPPFPPVFNFRSDLSERRSDSVFSNSPHLPVNFPPPRPVKVLDLMVRRPGIQANIGPSPHTQWKGDGSSTLEILDKRYSGWNNGKKHMKKKYLRRIRRFVYIRRFWPVIYHKTVQWILLYLTSICLSKGCQSFEIHGIYLGTEST